MGRLSLSSRYALLLCRCAGTTAWISVVAQHRCRTRPRHHGRGDCRVETRSRPLPSHPISSDHRLLRAWAPAGGPPCGAFDVNITSAAAAFVLTSLLIGA